MRARPRRAAVVAQVVLAVLAAFVAASSAAAPFEDSMAQRVLACTGCHGPQGRAAPDGYYPRIAGKPAGYLYNQLLNFRDERRHYALMNGLLAPLDDSYLREIAGYFAGLDIPYPPPAAASLGAADRARAGRLINEGDAQRGVPPCIACHGKSMTGTAPFVPGLLGLPRDYLNAQLGAWREDKRRAQAPDCMSRVAKAIAPDEISAISAWLAAQPVPADAKPAAAFAASLPFDCGGVGNAASLPLAASPSTTSR
ncbi:MAG: c-type cytochrome [Pseudomonadota bacterium]|nr:c-type cytochrome [Pseudomonadota bacterium]